MKKRVGLLIDMVINVLIEGDKQGSTVKQINNSGFYWRSLVVISKSIFIGVT